LICALCVPDFWPRYIGAIGVQQSDSAVEPKWRMVNRESKDRSRRFEARDGRISPLPRMRMAPDNQRENDKNQKNKAVMCMKPQGRSGKKVNKPPCEGRGDPSAWSLLTCLIRLPDFGQGEEAVSSIFLSQVESRDAAGKIPVADVPESRLAQGRGE